jgi:dynein heavy chain, axonemal
VEQKLLPHLFKSNQKNYLKATKIPESRPEEPDAEDPRAMADENAWIYEQKARLMDAISTIIEPMEEYFKTYSKFEKENDMLSPVREMSKYEDPESWPTVDELRAMILTHKKEATRLMSEIPEEKIVSCFRISTKVIRDLMIAKHEDMAT